MHICNTDNRVYKINHYICQDNANKTEQKEGIKVGMQHFPQSIDDIDGNRVRKHVHAKYTCVYNINQQSEKCTIPHGVKGIFSIIKDRYTYKEYEYPMRDNQCTADRNFSRQQ